MEQHASGPKTWVLAHSGDLLPGVLYWDGRTLSSSSYELEEAVRFSRKQDADRLCQIVSGWGHDWRVQEL